METPNPSYSRYSGASPFIPRRTESNAPIGVYVPATPPPSTYRNPAEIQGELVQEQQILHTLHTKIADQLHRLQVEEMVLKKQVDPYFFETREGQEVLNNLEQQFSNLIQIPNHNIPDIPPISISQNELHVALQTSDQFQQDLEAQLNGVQFQTGDENGVMLPEDVDANSLAQMEADFNELERIERENGGVRSDSENGRAQHSESDELDYIDDEADEDVRQILTREYGANYRATLQSEFVDSDEENET